MSDSLNPSQRKLRDIERFLSKLEALHERAEFLRPDFEGQSTAPSRTGSGLRVPESHGKADTGRRVLVFDKKGRTR